MKWLIWVPDHGETAECSGQEYDCGQEGRGYRRSIADFAEHAAEKYADEVAWGDWGWEHKWPIDFRLRHVETGQEFDVDVHMEAEPTFSSGGASRVWQGDEIYRNLAKAYAPAEARR